MVKKFMGFILATVLLISAMSMPFSAFAADDFESVKAAGTLDVEGARGMLNDVNEFRKGENNWYWNEDDVTKSNCSGTPYVYDEQLEAIAQKRAVELAILYDQDHYRPNGTKWHTAFDEANYPKSAIGENIAKGQKTAREAVSQWREDEFKYKFQSHRRAMLSDKYVAIGIAHFIYNGEHYWVQEFSSKTSGNIKTETTEKGSNGIKVTLKTVSVKASKIKKKKATLKAITVKNAHGAVSYAKVTKGSSKKLSINKTTGKITVKKGTKKGTYKIKVKITAKGDATHKGKTITKTVTVKVK